MTVTAINAAKTNPNTTADAVVGSCCSESQGDKECFHCHAPMTGFSNVVATVAGDQVDVCCQGCKSAAEFIAEQGLADFYAERDASRMIKPAVEPTVVLTEAPFDANEWGIERDAGQCRVSVSVPAIYCGSCAWLIQKSLEALNQQRSLDLSIFVHTELKQVSLTWQGQNSEDLGLPLMLAQLHKLGYSANPLRGGHWVENKTLEQENAVFLKRILVAGLGTMQVMTYAVAHYVGAEASPDIARFLELFSMLVATCVVMYSGQHFFTRAWRDIKNRHLGMDVPVALAIGAAFFLSAIQTLSQWEGRVLYYDSAVMFVFFLLAGRYVETRARHRFVDSADALSTSLPRSVVVLRGADDVERQKVTTTPRAVRVGDTVSVTNGEAIPFDGVIVNGLAEIDESLVTGESAPVTRGESEHVLASMRVVSGQLTLRCTREWQDSSLASLESLIDAGHQAGQKNDTKMALISRYFVVAILLMTALVGGGWLLFEPSRAFEVVLAMLIASCPCAFALAAPVGTTVASNVLRRHGVLLANGESLALLANAEQWWFDKTGTLTQGKPEIVSVTLLSEYVADNGVDKNSDKGRHASVEATRDGCLDIISALERPSKHPLANAFTCRDADMSAQQWSEQPGCGVTGVVHGVRYFVGKLEWVREQIAVGAKSSATLSSSTLSRSTLSRSTQANNNQRAEPVESGFSRLYLAGSNRLLACVELQDSPKPGLATLLSTLARAHVKSVLISGDNQSCVDAFTTHVRFDRCYAEQTPEQKLGLIQATDQTQRPNVVVGDGANDAPMLAQGDVAIAFASGSELSQAQADIVVLNRDLTALVLLRRVAQVSQRIMNQNVIWAIGYNVAILPLAAFGLLTPWIAAIGMSLSSLMVVLNAGRIVRVR